jgi:hypothetical protein
MIPYSNGQPPRADGQVQLYETEQKPVVTEWYKPARRAVYINGQVTSGERHRDSAQAVSLLQMCPVIGVFNQASSTAWHAVMFDTLQSLGDKWQFDHPFGGGPAKYFDRHANGTGGDRVRAMEDVLARNAATLATFRLFRSGEVPPGSPVFAHSQGNLILSNALTALALINGPAAVAGIEVHSFGSPTVHWPAGIKHYDHAFTGDLVALLNPVPNFCISKVGLPTGVKPWGFVSHDFFLYLKDDAQFVINRHRWGGWGVTFNMDEDGLAETLVGMGDNEPRVRAIFERLDRKHRSDADDVACAYVKKMRANPDRAAALQRMRRAPLIPLLIRLMDEGWTSAEERATIDFLRAL